MAKDSILLRSAESIGRVIGTLQRQLDTAKGNAPFVADDSNDTAERRSERGLLPIKRKTAARTAKRPKAATASGSRKTKRPAKASGAQKATKRTRKATRSR